jgi:hypothetical protein
MNEDELRPTDADRERWEGYRREGKIPRRPASTPQASQDGLIGAPASPRPETHNRDADGPLTVTGADRSVAEGITDTWGGPGARTYRDLTDAIAVALAAERHKTRAPFLALADQLDSIADLISDIVGRLSLRDAAKEIRRAAQEQQP